MSLVVAPGTGLYCTVSSDYNIHEFSQSVSQSVSQLAIVGSDVRELLLEVKGSEACSHQ